MIKEILRLLLFGLFIVHFVPLLAKAELQSVPRPFVIGKLREQLGNNLFQVAATCAHAWDHGADPYFPDLLTIGKTKGMELNYPHIFSRFNPYPPNFPISLHWHVPPEKLFYYYPIPYLPYMEIEGTFQCEKFFAHHRGRLLELLAPLDEDLAYIKKKFKNILKHPCCVGVQVRWFGGKYDLKWTGLAQYGYDFFNKAMAMFPKDTLFVVCTNNMEFARKNIPKEFTNIIFIEGQPHYIDFFLLSMCKHNIISNSTFGWWAAWLNKNPKKQVVVPQHWVKPGPVVDVWPKEWIKVNAKWANTSAKITSIK